jgi:hypothetical protein
MLLAGGTSTACDELRTALEAAPPEACFVHVDVKGFYAAIAVGAVAEITGLDRAVVHRHLAFRPRRTWKGTYRRADIPLMDLVVSRREGLDRQEPSGGGERPESGETVPAALPTGSAAASIVAEMVMGDVLRDVGALRDALCILVYSDNIGVLAPSREAAQAIMEALLNVLRAHRAGPFSASRATIDPIERGFDFLGYRWKVVAGEPKAEPKRARHEHWQLKTLTKAQSGSAAEIDECIRSLRSYCAYFKHWEGAAEFEREMGQRLRFLRSQALWDQARRLTRAEQGATTG